MTTSTSPLLPEPLKVVAHLIEGGRTWKARAMTTTDSDIATRDAASRKDGSVATPLVRLSEAEAAINALRAEVAALRAELKEAQKCQK